MKKNNLSTSTQQHPEPKGNIFFLTCACLSFILYFSLCSTSIYALELGSNRDILGLPPTSPMESPPPTPSRSTPPPKKATPAQNKQSKTRVQIPKSQPAQVTIPDEVEQAPAPDLAVENSSPISAELDKAISAQENESGGSDDTSGSLGADEGSGSLADLNSSSEANASKSAKSKTINLFGHVEFRGAIKNTPKWQRVMKKEQELKSFSTPFEQRLSPEVRARWQKLKAKLKDLPLMDKIKGVNAFFNQWPYKTDMSNWKIEDYWATPLEFMLRSGDCEDYAITKYFALRDLNVPANELRIVAVMDKIKNIGHAILVVFVDDKAYVLDNLTGLLLTHNRLTNYEPKFSVNEEHKWVHVKPIKKARSSS